MRMRVGEEKHQDGGTHFHVIAVFGAKLNLHTVTCFDIVGPGGVREHPNIRKFDKKQLISRLCYASKDGKTTDFGVWKVHSLFPDSNNYLKKKADHEAWMQDSKVTRATALQVIFLFRLLPLPALIRSRSSTPSRCVSPGWTGGVASTSAAIGWF